MKIELPFLPTRKAFTSLLFVQLWCQCIIDELVNQRYYLNLLDSSYKDFVRKVIFVPSFFHTRGLYSLIWALRKFSGNYDLKLFILSKLSHLLSTANKKNLKTIKFLKTLWWQSYFAKLYFSDVKQYALLSDIVLYNMI